MAAPTAPNLANTILPWPPVSYWRPGSYDAATLLDMLKAQPALGDYEDNTGMQSRVRIDADIDPANTGWWITIPAEVDQAEIDAAIAAYAPPPDPGMLVATANDHAAVTAAYVTANLATVGIPRDQLEPVIAGMLQLSEQFIPKLQGAIADWATLTAAQKDRLLEDLANFALIQMQYTTGLLPTAPPTAPPA